jgi:hypothetical protein
MSAAELGATIADFDEAERGSHHAAATTGTFADIPVLAAFFDAAARAAPEAPAHFGHGDDGDAIVLDRLAENGASRGANADLVREHLDDVVAAAAGGFLCFAKHSAHIVSHGDASMVLWARPPDYLKR